MNEELIIGGLGICYVLTKLNEDLKYRIAISKFQNNIYTLVINPIDIDSDNIYDFSNVFMKFSNIINTPHTLTLYHMYQETYFSSYIDIQFVCNFKTENIELLAYDLIKNNLTPTNYKSFIDVPIYEWSKENIEIILSDRQRYNDVVISNTDYVYLIPVEDKEQYGVIEYYDKRNIKINY